MAEPAHQQGPYFWPAWFLCAAASLVPIWSVPYLPMTDLPQHAVQISIINNLNNPAFGFSSQFALNWFTPYALVYFVAALLAKVFGLMLSLKIMVSLSVLALPAALFHLLRETGRDPWLSIYGFPLAFGFNFLWGFLNYIVALPVGLLFITLGVRFLDQAALKRGIQLAVCGVILFFCHGLVFGFCVLSYTMMAFSDRKKGGVVLARLLPLVLLGLLALAWVAFPSSRVPEMQELLNWGKMGAIRVRELIAYCVSSSSNDHLGFIFGSGLILSLFFWNLPRFNSMRFVLPFMLALVLFLFGPDKIFAIWAIYQRFAVFAFLFFIMTLEPVKSRVATTGGRCLAVALVVIWMAHLTAGFKEFNKEAQDVEEIIRKVPPQKNIFASTLLTTKHGFGGGEYAAHLPAYYQAFNGGGYWESFALDFKSVARYKPGTELRATIKGSRVDLSASAPFDYYLIRCPTDPTGSFLGAFQTLGLQENQGAWWLYKRVWSNQ